MKPLSLPYRLLSKQNLAAAFVVALGIGIGWSTLRPAAGQGAGRANDASTEATGAVTTLAVDLAAPRPSARDLAAGRSFVYEVSATRSVGGPGGPAAVSTTVAGSLSFVVVGSAEGGAVVRIALGSPRRTETPRPSAEPTATLAIPFFVVVRPDGAVSSWYFPKTMPSATRRQLRSIVSAMQVVADDTRGVWERTEADENGQFVARYEAQGDTLLKTKQRYDFVRTPQGLAPTASIGTYEVTGGSRIVLDASRWPLSVDEDATTTVSFQGGSMRLMSRLHAKLVSAGDTREHLGSFEAARPGFDPDPESFAEEAARSQRSADEGLVQGATVASLAADYEAAGDRKGKNRAVARLGALLRTQPDATEDARARMVAKGTKEATARALASALGAAGTPSAQHALADALASHDLPFTVKNDAAISLGLTDKPSAEAKAALRTAMKESGEIAQTATLALGNMANVLAKEGGAATDIVLELLAKLESATTAEQKVLFLDALGNAGDARALQAIKGHLTESEAVVRAAATAALRFQTSTEVPDLLRVLVQDPAVLVRKAALSAMGQSDVVRYLASLQHVLEAEPQAELRKSAVRLVARALDHGPEAAALLGWSSQHDEDADVKALATAALSHPK